MALAKSFFHYRHESLQNFNSIRGVGRILLTIQINNNVEKQVLGQVIQYLHLKGLTSKKIKPKLDAVHGTFAPASATIYNWRNEFK